MAKIPCIEMIETRKLNKQKLLEYIHSKDFGKGEAIPISMHRALSQCENPHLQDNDTLLILAEEQGEMIGYIGAMCDYMHLPKAEPYRMTWLTSMWVSEKARGKGLAVRLMSEAVDAANGTAIAADYAPYTLNIYKKTGQFASAPFQRKGIRLYVKFDTYTILAPKKAIFCRLGWLLKSIDFLLNFVLSLLFSLRRAQRISLKFEYVNEIDQEVNSFMAKTGGSEIFQRRASELNWIMKNPWILSRNAKDELNSKYEFSSTAKSFEFNAVKIRNNEGTLIGFILFSRKNGAMKLPYIFHDDSIEAIAKAAEYHIRKWRIKTATTFHPDLSAYWKGNKTPALFKKEIVRNYMITQKLEKWFFKTAVHMQDGDGDCVFT